MNWIFASQDPNMTWQKSEQDWGLGKYDAVDLGLKNERWTSIAEQITSENKISILYKTKCMDVRVQRESVGQDYVETYTFVNTTGKKLSISGLDIYTPFNDNYPDAKIAATNRCNAHIWAGMNASPMSTPFEWMEKVPIWAWFSLKVQCKVIVLAIVTLIKTFLSLILPVMFVESFLLILPLSSLKPTELIQCNGNCFGTKVGRIFTRKPLPMVSLNWMRTAM